MGRTLAAFPWQGPLFASQTKNGLGQKLKNGGVFNRLTFERSVLALALLHLGGMGGVLFSSEILAVPIVVGLTGSLLILLLGYRYGRSWLLTASPSNLKPLLFELTPHAEDLKDRSITFHELVQSTQPAQTETLLSGSLWAELTARMSHDLRTPLNAVLGFSDLIQAETFGPLGDERYRDYIQHIQDSCRDLLRSTENTLAMTSVLGKRSPQSPADRVSFFQLLHETEDFFKSELHRRGIELSYPAPSVKQVLGDKGPLQQILRNVFAEALYRVRDEGSLEVATEIKGSHLALTLHIQNPKSIAHFEQDSLELCIARVLLKHQGSHLVVESDATTWSLTLFLDRVVEEDFFPRAALC